MISEKMRDYVLYVGISLLIAILIVSAAVFGVPRETFRQWLAFLMFSGFIYAQVIITSKVLWRNRKFWSAIALLVIFNTVFFFTASRTSTQMPIWCWIMAAMAEVVLLTAIRNQLLIREFKRLR